MWSRHLTHAGGAILQLDGWTARQTIETDNPWELGDLAEWLPELG
ncbi:hypothetical protein ACFQZZ_09180 [Nocardia sp. GCM10030253]